MFTTDMLIALWAISIMIAIPIAYFRGAKRQLEVCSQHRNNEMDDIRWMEAVDISKKRL